MKECCKKCRRSNAEGRICCHYIFDGILECLTPSKEDLELKLGVYTNRAALVGAALFV